MLSPGILPEPIKFGHYYLLELVNLGGMAEVYRAKKFGAEGFEKQLAVKKILSKVAEEQGFVDMFIDEAKILVQLNHPNIVQIDELGLVEGAYCIVMEYISGRDLKALYKDAKIKGEPLSIPQVCYIISEVCDGLGYAHEKLDRTGKPLNIVHRDISPQNVIISYEGEVKLIDFGIAIAANNTNDESNTGVLRGKYSYMSPEQVRGEELDARSDLFSLGVLMYELLTLTRLFRGETLYATLQNIHQLNITPPSELIPDIPEELEAIVLKALAGDRDERYQSAFEFRRDIERFFRSSGYFYSGKELANYMRDAFSENIAEEVRKERLFRSWRIGPEEFLTPVEELETVDYDTAGIRPILDDDSEDSNPNESQSSEPHPSEASLDSDGKSNHSETDEAWAALGLRQSQRFTVPPSPALAATGPYQAVEFEPDESSFPELSDSGLKDFGIEEFQAYKSARYDVAALEREAARKQAIAQNEVPQTNENNTPKYEDDAPKNNVEQLIEHEEETSLSNSWLQRLLIVMIVISILIMGAIIVAKSLLTSPPTNNLNAVQEIDHPK